MLSKNMQFTVEIESVSSDGSGIARIEGMTVFVPGAITGEIVRIHIVKVNKTYCFAKIIEIIEKSADRIDPACDTYSRCGGCAMMHMNYSYELQVKRQRVIDAMERIGKLNIEVGEPLGGEPERYRNKAMFPVDENLNFGFFGKSSHRLIPCIDCKIMPSEFTEIAREIVSWAKEKCVSGYNEVRHTGLIRTIFIRKVKDLAICIVINGDSIPHKESLIERLKKYSPASITLSINKKRSNTLLGDKTLTVFGSETVNARLCGLDFKLSPRAFFQVNTCQAERLYSLAGEFADLNGNETLLDLYCGTGTIGLSLAGKVKKLIGVEVIPEAVENARENARINGIENAEFICADAREAAQKLKEDNIKPDVIILDPPRKGCEESLIKTVFEMSPKRIVYVSCDPATLARDLKLFDELGYKSDFVQPVDMFPRTTHVETVCLLSKTKK